ncbi:MAG: VWA domain-containing protein [Ardenticatenia bacterium]|nr:VWA domain-containing protein [Ardenticatenia bacterium]
MSLGFTHPGLLGLLALLPLMWYVALSARRRAARQRTWAALAARTLLFLALVLALAGIHLRRPADTVAVVFLVDVSDSIPPRARAEAVNYMRAALATKPAEGRAGVVVFGRDALVERTVGDLRGVDALESTPVRTHTDIEEAVRLGLALLPGDAQGRLVLLSDGQANEGRVERAVQLAAAQGIPVDVVPLEGGMTGPEVVLADLRAPQRVREGQALTLEVEVEATVSTQARLRVWEAGGGRPVEERIIDISPGHSRVVIPLQASRSGVFRYRATLEPVEDTRAENNVAETVVFVDGAPRVLVVTLEPQEVSPLVRALSDAGVDVEMINPAGLPTDPTTLADYDTVVLANVPAAEVTRPAQEALRAFVRDMGHGLIMVGGPQSFGAGLWHRTPVEEALPVSMEVRTKEREPNVALVMVVDKSGSMGQCHCEDPNDPNATAQRLQAGLAKVDIAKEAILQAAFALGDMDVVGVVAFDQAARWVVDPQPFVGPTALEEAIAGLEANGPTNIVAGLRAAGDRLAEVQARVRHIILVTDGWSRAGDYQPLAERLRQEGITLSVVAAGRGAALEDLAGMAADGGGRFYPADSLDDIPRIFLKETIRVAGRYIVEEPFLPVPVAVSPVVRGIDPATMPPLLGYNGTTAKGAATEVLTTLWDDPLLALWQYGLGRSVAWTSDFSGRWGRELVAWERFGDFVAQLVAWTYPLRASETLEVTSEWEGSTVRLYATSKDATGKPRNFLRTEARILAPDGQTVNLELSQVGPGEYASTFVPDQVGAYVITVVQRDAEGLPIDRAQVGLVVPYSPEYRLIQADGTLLREAARTTGGRLAPPPDHLFAPTGDRVYRRTPVWPLLLVLAALLLPLDVALRRLAVGRRELRRLWERVRARWPSGPVSARATVAGRAPERPELFAAKARARRRRRVQEAEPAAELSNQEPPSPATPPPPPARPASGAAEAEDTLARLRAVKRRRRQR